MKKIFLLAAFVLFFKSLLFSQISVYVSHGDGIIGYSVGSSNENFVRDNSAENDCINKGGKNPRLEFSNNGYGCYAIVKGSKEGGGFAIGVSYGGNRSVEQCINDAKSRARFYGATEKSLYVYAQGCITAPNVQNSTNHSQTTQKKPEWSNWKKINSSKCDVGIEYSTLREERYQLNYQLWFYYKVRNTSNKNISFNFHLTRNGKKEFGHGHILSPGGEDEWMHKMSANNIDGVSVTNILNTATNKDVCDESSTKNQNNGESDEDLINEINTYLYQIDDNNPTKKGIMERISLAQNSKSLSQTSYFSLLKNEKENAKRLLASLGRAAKFEDDQKLQLEENQKKLQAEEKERLKKESEKWVQKTSNFTNLMQEGYQLQQSEKYDEAIAKYNQAKSLYTGEIAPQEKQYAESAIKQAETAIASAQKAKVDAARIVRVQNQKDEDKKEDVAYGAAATSTTGLMAMLTDRYAYKPAYFRFQAGLGVDDFPLVVNTDNLAKSGTSTSMHPTILLGFKFGFLNTRGISIHFNPSLAYGINAYNTGTSGIHVNTGVTSTLFFGRKATSKIKLFAEGGYLDRLGNLTYDLDVAAGGTSATDKVEKGEYKYSVIKYGGGLMVHFVNKRALKESYIKPGIFFEKMSFSEPNIKPVMLFNLQTNIESFIIIDLSYSKNYAIGGKILYPNNFTPENQTFWSIKLIRQGAF